MTNKYFTTNDVQVGQVMEGGAYKGAEVVTIARNGWCKMKWPNRTETFSVRVHWLTYQTEK